VSKDGVTNGEYVEIHWWTIWCDNEDSKEQLYCYPGQGEDHGA